LFHQRGGGGGSSDSNYSEGDLSACLDDERRPPPPQQKILDDELATTDDADLDNDATTTTSSTSILSSLTGGQHLSYSAYSIQGERQYMEDEYFVEQNGRFAAVFDGHGGGSVSKYLRQNLYANFQAALPQSASKKYSAAIDITNQNDVNTKRVEESTMAQQYSNSQSSIVASALETAFDKVDNEVGSISHWSFQGSTALAIAIHENIHGNDDDTASTRYIVAANVGDSRAILSRGRTAVDLTKDHKPNDESERDRIESLGGTVDWCGEVNSKGHPIEHTGVYRINGNLALSRSIGDRSERPWVTNAVDITHFLVDEERDAFVLLATDGLYDVMSSRDIVTFVHDLMDRTTNPERRQELRHDIAKYVAEEALRRGTTDNVTVLVLWLNNFS
jgi:serine/threonine protein phosphatase PrpC